MSDPPQEKKSKKSVLSRLLSAFKPKRCNRNQSPSPQVKPLGPVLRQATTTLVPHSQETSARVPPSTSSSSAPDTNLVFPAITQANSGPHKTASPVVPTPTADTTQPQNLNLQDDQVHYTAIGGLPTGMDVRTNAVGGTVYEGLKTVVEGLYGCSDMFLPLKTASGMFLKIAKTVEVRSSFVKQNENV